LAYFARCALYRHHGSRQIRRIQTTGQKAQAEAERAISHDDRARWLNLVQGWLGMIPGRDQNEEEKFDSAAEAQATKQKDSDASN
jgi:hypothetical protein